MVTPYWTNMVCLPELVDSAVECVRLVYGEDHREAERSYWDWRYLSPNEFHADVMVSVHENQVIAVALLAPQDWQWGEQRIKGAWHGAAATHPDHRRKGIFSTLVNTINERSAERGVVFLHGTPNDNSLPGFIKFGDWGYVASVPMFIKVLNVPAVLRPKVGKALATLAGGVPQLFFGPRRDLIGSPIDIELAESVPQEMDEVFEGFSGQCNALMMRKTANYWNWRFAARPGDHYRILLARQGGRLVGGAALSLQQQKGIDVGMVIDMVTRDGVTGLRQLLRGAEEDFRSRGLGLASCQATSAMLQRALREERYRELTTKQMGRSFHHIYRLTGLPGLLHEPKDSADWHYGFADSDNT